MVIRLYAIGLVTITDAQTTTTRVSLFVLSALAFDHFFTTHIALNPVDGDEVPVPHAGLALTVEQFHELAERVREAGVKFIIEPHLRFKDAPGEQWTMFFKDPSGNNLEFKAMTKMENLFAKYNVVD